MVLVAGGSFNTPITQCHVYVFVCGAASRLSVSPIFWLTTFVAMRALRVLSGVRLCYSTAAAIPISSTSTRHLHTSRVTSLPMVPFVIEQTGRGERSYDIYSRLLRERIVCLMGAIDDSLASVVVAQLLFLQSESTSRPVHVYVNSGGGIVTSGLAIYDTMQYIRPPVATWCVGQACSMAALLLAAGSPGMRHALPNSRIMVHQPSGGAQGQASDIQIQAAEIAKLKLQINGLFARHTGQALETVEKSMDRDNFMSPDEALKFGLIDTILEHPPKHSAEPTPGEGASVATSSPSSGDGPSSSS